MGIDDEIAQVKATLAELERKAELLRAELRGLERGRKYVEASAKPSVSSTSFTMRGQNHLDLRPLAASPHGTGHRGGRQPGAISQRWKLVLASVMDGVFDTGAVVDSIAQLEGRKVKASEVRRQFEGYMDQGLIEHVDKDRDEYRIPAAAVDKLRLREIRADLDSGARISADELRATGIIPQHARVIGEE